MPNITLTSEVMMLRKARERETRAGRLLLNTDIWVCSTHKPIIWLHGI